MKQVEVRKSRATGALATVGVLLVAGLGAVPGHAQDGQDEAYEELIVNGSFEDGLTDWFANNGNTADSANLEITDDASDGEAAVHVSERATTGSGPMQDLSGKIQAGQTYEISAQVKYDAPDSPATNQFFATMHYGGADYTNLGSVTPERGEWGQIEATFTVPADQSVSTARLFLETPWTSDPGEDPDVHLMDFTVDEVSLVGTPPPPPASRTIEVAGKEPGDHNPIISHKFGADGYGFAHDGRVYMYMTNDTQGYAPDPDTGISPQINYGDINQITVVSSQDLVNWTDHGEIQVAGPNGVAPFTNNSWAPGMASQVVDGEEKFFLYYANGGGSSNVITGQSPLGPWESERSSVLISGSTPGTDGVAWPFDPAPFVDDDGEGYLYYGGGPAATDMPPEERYNNPKNLRAIELGADMVSVSGTAAVVDAPVAFEAAQVFKREDLYYLSYSSHFGGSDFGGNQTPEPGYPAGGQIGYMISDDPMAWDKDTYAGVMFPNQSEFFGAGTGGNNHQSVFEFNDTFYFTHHAPTLNKRINGDNTQGYRSPHIEELTFNDDGTVEQVEGSYAGVAQVQDFAPYRVFEAETFGWNQGVATQETERASAEFDDGAPNLVVSDIDDGDWTALSSVAFGDDGAATVTATVRPLQDGGQIQVRSGAADGPVLGTIDVAGATGEWTEVSAELTGATGTMDVYFTYTGADGNLFELDAWSFEPAAAAPVLDVDLETGARCVVGTTFVTVRALNNEDVTVALDVESAHGSRSFPAVAPGAHTFHAFTTRQAEVTAGAVSVSLTGTVDGETVTTAVEAPYEAHSCG